MYSFLPFKSGNTYTGKKNICIAYDWPSLSIDSAVHSGSLKSAEQWTEAYRYWDANNRIMGFPFRSKYSFSIHDGT